MNQDTHSTPSMHPARRARAGAVALAAAFLLALAGCGATGPGGYPGARAQADRARADEAATASDADAMRSPATYVRLIEQMQRDGLWYASLAHLDALEREAPPEPATLRLRADALRRTGQVAESRRQYQRLLETPLAGAAYHGLGLLAGADGDFVQAGELLAQARRHDPTDAVVLSDLGYAYLRAGGTAQARVPLMQADQLRPDHPQVQANLALYLFAVRRANEAEAFMAARGIAPGTRHAIRQAARELAPGAPRGVAPTSTPGPATGSPAAPSRSRPAALRVADESPPP